MENYKLVEKIGKGTHGTVYLVKSLEEDKLVVCKLVNNKYKNHAFREISILSKINHRRIVTMVDSMVIKNSINIVLEYINHGSLETMIDFFRKCRIDPNNALGWSLISQIGDALYYLHSKKIIHRDIKPANILVSRFFVGEREYLEFKLCDFSLSTQCESYINDGHIVGTPFYMAPEMVSRGRYNHTIDVWGLGCCVFELMNLYKPFTGEDRMELFENIIKTTPICKEVWGDPMLNILTGRCLEKSERINAKAIARNEKARLNLAILELRIREHRIEQLEKRLDNLEKSKKQLRNE
ncbi:hypothetical protein GINT2_002207 [Glugoides intestinalis]